MLELTSSAHGERNVVVAGGVSRDDQCRWRQFWPTRGRHNSVVHANGRTVANEGKEETFVFEKEKKKP